MFENFSLNVVVTNVCALSGGVILGLIIKGWLKKEPESQSKTNTNSFEEEVII